MSPVGINSITNNIFENFDHNKDKKITLLKDVNEIDNGMDYGQEAYSFTAKKGNTTEMVQFFHIADNEYGDGNGHVTKNEIKEMITDNVPTIGGNISQAKADQILSESMMVMDDPNVEYDESYNYTYDEYTYDQGAAINNFTSFFNDMKAGDEITEAIEDHVADYIESAGIDKSVDVEDEVYEMVDEFIEILSDPNNEESEVLSIGGEVILNADVPEDPTSEKNMEKLVFDLIRANNINQGSEIPDSFEDLIDGYLMMKGGLDYNMDDKGWDKAYEGVDNILDIIVDDDYKLTTEGHIMVYGE